MPASEHRKKFPLPLAAAALSIALLGNGTWSLDRVFGLRYPDQALPAWLGLMAVGDVLVLLSRAVFAPKPVNARAA